MLRIWPENTLLTRAPQYLTEDTERSQAGTGCPFWAQERRMYTVTPLGVDIIGSNTGSAI